MDYLKLDKQTIKDLNIFPTRDEQHSILDYFEQTQTHGGKFALNNIMQTPLADANEIINRSSAIRYLREQSIELELGREEIEFIEHYLNQNILILKSNPIDSIWNWLRNKYKPTNEYFLISRGLDYLRTHIKLLNNLLSNITESNHPVFFDRLKNEFQHIQNNPRLKEFISIPSKNIPFWKLGRYDYMVRVKEKETIKALLKFTYELDALLSVAMVSKERGLVVPSIEENESAHVQIAGLFHPFLKQPVKNDFVLGDSNLLFLSGANMSGKSTYLKSVGLCIYLAHLGFPVPATSMKHSIFKGLYSTINISDSIERGLSHYYSEVKRVKEIALEIERNKNIFVIFDELFRGTNVKDAEDATLLIVKRFSRIKSSHFLISTHITEVAERLRMDKDIVFKCFHAGLEGQVPTYDYKLRDGVSSERLGLSILKNEKVLEILDGLTE